MQSFSLAYTPRNAVNALDAANVAAQDGGKTAKAAQASARENLIEEYKLTAAYVIKMAAGDMEKITSANLPVITPKTVVEPAGGLLPPVPRKLVRGPNPGELSLFTRAVPGAHGYQGRYGAIWPTPGPWTEFPIPKVKSATTIRGLTPGTRYAIQVRALGDQRLLGLERLYHGHVRLRATSKLIIEDIPTVAALYERRQCSRLQTSPAVIDRRYSSN